MFLTKIKNYLLLSILFLLPWQTRLIYTSTQLGKYDWEYGRLSLYGVELLLAGLIILTLVEKIRDKNFTNHLAVLPRTRLVAVLFGISAILLIYLGFVSPMKEVSWQYINWIIYAFCLSVIIIESKVEFRKLVFCLWAGGVVQGALAIGQFFNQSIEGNKWLGIASHRAAQLGTAVLDFGDERYLRAYGSFGWPNALGIYLSAIFLIGIILLCHSCVNGNLGSKSDSHFRGNDNLIFLVGQIIILVGLFFTFARGAWLATCLGVIIFIWKNYKNKILWQQLFIYGLVGIILLFIFKPLVFSRIDFQNRLEIKSISQRVEQWQDFKTIFSKNTFFGVGPGVYTYGLFVNQLNHNHDFQPVHNIYLLFLGEWGIIGAGGLWMVIYYLYKRADWLFSPLWSLLVAGLFDHWTLSMFTGLVFLGVIFALAVRNMAIDSKGTKE